MKSSPAVCLFASIGLAAASSWPPASARQPAQVASASEPGGNCPDHEAIDIGGGYVISAAKCENTYEAWLVADHRSTDPARPPRVVDHMTLRPLAPAERFSIGPYCYRNGKSIFWVAIYDWRGKKKISRQSGGIREAWVANPGIGRFEPASADLIASAECLASDDE